MKDFFIIFLLIFCTLLQSKTSFCWDFEDFYAEALENFEFSKQAFQYLHQHPELGHAEYETSAYLQTALNEMGVHFTTGWGGPAQDRNCTGIIAEVGTGQPPCVAFRADFDALPIHEEVDLPYKSTHTGVMHACGHDAHTTMLLGAVKLLKAHEHQLEGTVKFFFQPAEERGGGAINMVAEGALTDYPPVQALYGFHVTPQAPTGVILSNSGHITCSANLFTIKVEGKGGHIATHFKAIDPVPTAVAIAQKIHTFNARELYPQTDKTGVITMTDLHTYNENSFNVIPGSMEIKGTIRTLSQNRTNFVMERMAEIVEATGTAHKCNASISYYLPEGSISTYNDPILYSFFAKVAPKAAVDKKLGVRLPSLGGEDFAYYSNSDVPCLFSYLGMGSGEVDGYPTNVPYHTPQFVMDPNLFPRAQAFYTLLAFETLEDFLKAPKTSSPQDEL